jgi:hypothetical protein
LGEELFGLARADSFVNVERFKNFEEFIDRVNKWYNFIKVYIKDEKVFRFFLLMKLI